jgi:peptide/nickel transport system permease protein
VTGYVVRRWVWIIATLVIVSIINFFVVFLVPANPADAIAGDKATPQVMAQIEQYYGLNKPAYIQYLYYMGHLLHGDLGTSYQTNLPVTQEIAQRVGATALLAICAFALMMLFGLGSGFWAGIKPGSRTDGVLTAIALFFNSLPTFWLGTMLLYYVGFRLGWLPLGGYGTGTHLRHVILPAMTLALVGAATYERLLRTQMADVRAEDYVRTARAKGLPEGVINVRHIARNALMPVVTIGGLDLAGLLSGVIIVETVFGWPGLGQLFYQAATSLDVPVIMATAMLSAVLIVVANFVVDMVYAVLDPRVTYH